MSSLWDFVRHPVRSLRHIADVLSLHPVAALVLAGLSLAAAASLATTFVHDEVNDLTLADRGVPAQVEVVGASHWSFGSMGSDGWAADYLLVRVPACACTVWIPTDRPAAHPEHSEILVRYDPQNPADVQPLVDNPTPWFLDLAAATLMGSLLFVSVSAAWVVWRRRRGPGGQTTASAASEGRAERTGRTRS